MYKNIAVLKILKGNTYDLINTLFLRDFNQIVYSEPSRTSKQELCTKIINGSKLLTILVESSISDVRLGSEYVSEVWRFVLMFS